MLHVESLANLLGLFSGCKICLRSISDGNTSRKCDSLMEYGYRSVCTNVESKDATTPARERHDAAITSWFAGVSITDSTTLTTFVQ